MGQPKPKLFISYSSQDVEFAAWLEERLRKRKLSVFRDQTRLQPGDRDWSRSVEQELDTATRLILVWSKAAKESKWVRREMARADARSMPILPVRLDDTPLPLIVQTHQCVDALASGQWSHAAEQIVRFAEDSPPVKADLPQSGPARPTPPKIPPGATITTIAEDYGDLHLRQIANCFAKDGVVASRVETAPSELYRNVQAYRGGGLSERSWVTRVYLQSGDQNYGFLHLRQEERHRAPGGGEEPPPLISAYLAVPNRLRDYDVIASPKICELYGLDERPHVSGYVVPHKSSPGFYSQASCQMSLLNALDKGGRCLGSFDITRIAFGAEDPGRTGRVEPVGLTSLQMAEVLGSSHAGINGILERLPCEAVAATIKTYLECRCPVILCLDAKPWFELADSQIDESERARLKEEISSKELDDRWHAVVIVGCKRSQPDGQTDFVVHDSWLSPFLTATSEELVQAAKAWMDVGRVLLIAAVPKEVRYGVSELRRLLGESHSKIRSAAAEESKTVRFRYRLIQRDQLVSVYLPDSARWEVPPDASYDVRQALSERCGAYLWAVEQNEGGRPFLVHLFNAAAPSPRRHIGKLARGVLELLRFPEGCDRWSLTRNP